MSWPRWMVILVAVLVISTVSATAHIADAARVDLDFATVRREGGAVVTATLHDVEEVFEKRPEYGDRPLLTAYRFNMHVVEALYGAGISAGDEIRIDKSGTGYGRVWERTEETAGYGDLGGHSVKPPEGTKVIAFLQPAKNGRRELYGYSSSVLVLDSFEDPRVEMWRRIAELWSMPISEELVAKLYQGSRSENLPFRLYCLDVLGENRADKKPFPEYTGIWLEGLATRGAIEAELWEVFTDDTTPFEAVLRCDRMFSGPDPKVRNPWQMHPVRYSILSTAIKRRVASDKRIDWQQIGWAVTGLSENPSRADHTREFILHLAETPDSMPPSARIGPGASSILMQLGGLYLPDAATDEARKLNDRIIEDLFIRLDDHELRYSAAGTLWSIAESSASVGILESVILERLQIAEKPTKNWRRQRISDKLARARKATSTTKLPDRLSWPYDAQVEKGVYVLSFGHGSPSGISVDGDWPRIDRNWEYAIIIGTLRKHDMPYFEVVAGKEFGEGIPIPSGFSPKSIAYRYSLENPNWLFITRAR